MAKKTQEEFIESLVASTNSNYAYQKRMLDDLLAKLDKAERDGASKEVLGVISGEISKLENSISKQTEYASDFYEEMVNLAGGRRDLDDKMLKDIMVFRQTFVEMTEKIKDLQESYRNEENGNNNPAELKRIQDEIKAKRAEYIKQYSQLKSNYGINSYATKAANNFVRDDEAQAKVLENINAKEEASKVNNQAIGKAIASNNEALENGAIIWGTIKKVSGEIWSQLKDGGNMWLKFNAQAISDSKRLGFTTKESARGYTKYLMETSKELSRNFGITADQAMKMQEAFSRATGKASLLSKSQMEDIAASSKLMGEETVSSAIEMMDNMGSTSQQATELLDKNYARAVNSGLDTVKASEAFVKNMSLANKLTFKSGVDGISKMTILSQRIKLNLQEVANVADKFGSIEGAIEGSAQLQMLGGAGAMFGGNPMQMMYEALSDPEALFERMGKMFGEQARFDRKTGEAKIDPLQLQIMREQAKAMGMNPDEAVQSAKQQAKIKDIEGYNRDLVNRYGKDSVEIAAIENKAQFDKKTGQWQITYQDETGETHENVDIKTLTPEQMKDIMKDNIDPVQDIRGRVKEIAMTLVGTKERLESMRDQWRTAKAQSINGAMEAGDTALTGINDSGIWKNLITSGGAGTIGSMIGLGLFSGAKYLGGALLAKGIGKSILGKIGNTKLGRSIGSSKRWNPFIKSAGSVEPVETGTRTVNAGATGSRLSGAGNRVRNAINTARNLGRVEGNAAAFSSAGNTIGTLRNMSSTIRNVKMGARSSGILAGVAEVATAGLDYYSAGEEAKASKAGIEALRQNNRMTSYNFERRKQEIENREDREKRGAIGQGIGGVIGAAGGIAAGAATGAAIGTMVPIPVVGTLAGMAVGAGMAWLGGKVGRSIGESTGEDKGVVEAELDKINDSDEEENLRRIVLPIESIDYNVALIANQLGIVSAMASRDNIYLKAEQAGEIQVEGVPLQAGQVNQVDANAIQQPTYTGGGTVNLNINGTIELTGGGQGVGKLTAQDIKKIIDNNPELQRHIADVITGRQGRNGNAGRNNYENADNRRCTTNSTYTGGI